jgi:hypothetical protein
MCDMIFEKSCPAGVVSHACNPIYSGGGDWNYQWFKAYLSKKLVRPPTTSQPTKRKGWASHPSYTGSISRRITPQAKLKTSEK